jgi:anti-sigma regulatory factor (Ser/Thr protein kinase)
MTLELRATPEEVMGAVEALQEFARAQHASEKVTFGLGLALEECGSNIMNHAYKKDPQQKFQVSFDRTGNEIVIELRDRGPAFDPTLADARQIAASDNDVPGGWGIQLVRRYMDQITYSRDGEENVLRLRKRIDAPDLPT